MSFSNKLATALQGVKVAKDGVRTPAVRVTTSHSSIWSAEVVIFFNNDGKVTEEVTSKVDVPKDSPRFACLTRQALEDAFSSALGLTEELKVDFRFFYA